MWLFTIKKGQVSRKTLEPWIESPLAVEVTINTGLAYLILAFTLGTSAFLLWGHG